MNKITNCEEMCMAIIWNSEETLCLVDIMNRVNEKFGQKWKPQTVSTFLHRLIEKNYLSACREGRVTYYSPLVDKKEYIRKNLKELIERICNGDISMVTELLEDGL